MHHRLWLGVLFLVAALLGGALLWRPPVLSPEPQASEPAPVVAPPSSTPAAGTPDADKPRPVAVDPAKRKELGPHVYLEVDGPQRRVLIDSYVCLREGQLEQLLTRRQGKEHEAILAADIDARHLQIALLAAGAKPGSPVKFEPKYVPARGSHIKITLQYEDKGKTVTVPAQQWIRVVKTQKDLASDWVFGGSQFVPNPLDPNKPDYFLANDGDIICVANFESALLDLPIESSQANADLLFEANTERIPALGTKVTIILDLVPEKGEKP